MRLPSVAHSFPLMAGIIPGLSLKLNDTLFHLNRLGALSILSIIFGLVILLTSP